MGNEVISKTHYADKYLQPIQAGQEMAFQFSDVPAGEGRARLRLGLGRKHDLSKNPELRVNGQPVSVPGNWPGYDQLNREDFFGVLEIPVKTSIISSNVSVQLTFPDSGGHVSTLVLITDCANN